MKRLFNIFIVFVLIFGFSQASYSKPDSVESNKDQNVKSVEKIRVININPDNYKNDYDKAIAADPWKGFNVAMFQFSNRLDEYFLQPVSHGYRFVIPQWGRNRVTDFFSNLGEIRNFTNSLLQGDIAGLFHAFWRMAINTGFGIGGLNDVASGFGLKEKHKDFSQTLAFYGVGSGPYLFVPFIGPSSPRDLFGSTTDLVSDPTVYLTSPASYIATGTDVVQTREGLLDITDQMKRDSFDLYSSYKSSYLQHRKKKVLDTLE